MSKSEVLSDNNLSALVAGMSLKDLRRALHAPLRPKGAKEAILGEIRRREAQEGRESLSYNSEAFSADGGMP